MTVKAFGTLTAFRILISQSGVKKIETIIIVEKRDPNQWEWPWRGWGWGEGRRASARGWQISPPVSFPVKPCAFSLQLSEGLAKRIAQHCSNILIIYCSLVSPRCPPAATVAAGPKGRGIEFFAFTFLLNSVLLDCPDLGIRERQSTKKEKKATIPSFSIKDSDLYEVSVSSCCLLDTWALSWMHRIQSADSASVGQLAPSPIVLLVSLSGPNTLDYQTISACCERVLLLVFVYHGAWSIWQRNQKTKNREPLPSSVS